MGRTATGTAYESRGRYFAQVPLGGGAKIARAVPSATSLDEARARARFATELCGALTKAGHVDLHAKIVELVCDAADHSRLDAIAAKVAGLCGGELVRVPTVGASPGRAETFEAFARRWTEGDLHRLYPDHVRPLGDDCAKDYRFKLRTYINPTLGPVPVAKVTLDQALEVMRKLPADLGPDSRRHVAKIVRRVLQLAVFPARLIDQLPLPKGFLPKAGAPKARGMLTRDTEARLLAGAGPGGAVAVDVETRLLFGVLAREGMRKEEAATLEWSDARGPNARGWVDLERGWVYLDQHKTHEAMGPKDWPLDPGVVAALARWRKGGPKSRYVFPSPTDSGRPLDVEHLADALREAVCAVGLDKAHPELLENTARRKNLVAHDLRAVFVTLALAQGRGEGWITRRTGHTSSAFNRYRRAAANLAEGSAVALVPLHEAIPELAGDSTSPIACGLPPGRRKGAPRRSRNPLEYKHIVRRGGLEPPRVAPLAPQASASAIPPPSRIQGGAP